MSWSRREFVRSVGWGGTGMLSLPFIISRGREELSARGIEGQTPPLIEPGFIRISGNENPRGPGDAALRALDGRVSFKVGRYPDNPPGLAETIAGVYRARADNVLLSTGSAGLLAGAVRAFTSPERPLVNASPSYGAPVGTARRIGTPIREVPVLADLSIDLNGMAEAAQGAGLVFLCNPNNPTSTFHSGLSVAAFIDEVRRSSPETMIQVDEAYIDYSEDPIGGTAVPFALDDPNVFVTRTFSKAYGMAGLRLGYAIGRPETMQKIEAAWGLGSVNVLTAAAAIASLNDPAHMERERQENARVREFVHSTFKGLGIDAPLSNTNFLFVNLDRPVGDFRDACLEHRVQVGRNFPPMLDHCRVSLGTMGEMRRASGVFAEVLRTG